MYTISIHTQEALCLHKCNNMMNLTQQLSSSQQWNTIIQRQNKMEMVQKVKTMYKAHNLSHKDKKKCTSNFLTASWILPPKFLQVKTDSLPIKPCLHIQIFPPPKSPKYGSQKSFKAVSSALLLSITFTNIFLQLSFRYYILPKQTECKSFLKHFQFFTRSKGGTKYDRENKCAHLEQTNSSNLLRKKKFCFTNNKQNPSTF